MKAVKYNTQFCNVFFTGDEHFFHPGIIRHHRPQFRNCSEMHEALINNHNAIVGKHDYVVHHGDFSFGSVEATWKIICALNGTHLFLEGCHDDTVMRISRRLNYHLEMVGRIYLMKVNFQIIVGSHYCMRTWPRKHYGSWNTYAHSHGKLSPKGAQWDVGVDNNDLCPIAFERLAGTISQLPQLSTNEI